MADADVMVAEEAPKKPVDPNFEPEIIVFACHYCAYAAGCMEGECHYLKGNLWARKRVDYVKKLLPEMGLEPERVEMYNMSSAMGPRFAEVATEFTERIKALGPSPARRVKEGIPA